MSNGYTDSGDEQRASNPVAATLRAARAQIADPARWTQGAYGRRTPDGMAYIAENVHQGCTCFCAAGAVALVVDDYDGPEADAVIHALAALISPDVGERYLAEDRLTRWNDEHTHADVLALFDRAIVAAESEATP